MPTSHYFVSIVILDFYYQRAMITCSNLFKGIVKRHSRTYTCSQLAVFRGSFSKSCYYYNRGNKCLLKSQITMFFTPFPSSLNVVIDLVAEKSTRFNTNTTLRNVGGEGNYFWPKFLPRY